MAGKGVQTLAIIGGAAAVGAGIYYAYRKAAPKYLIKKQYGDTLTFIPQVRNDGIEQEVRVKVMLGEVAAVPKWTTEEGSEVEGWFLIPEGLSKVQLSWLVPDGFKEKTYDVRCELWGDGDKLATRDFLDQVAIGR